MIITCGQAGPNNYHIDVFATATRGGFNDNVNFVRVDKSKVISNNAPETIVTTLPRTMNTLLSKSKYYGIFFSSKEDIFSNPSNVTPENFPKEEVYYGPGGNYLSNEILALLMNHRNKLTPIIN